MVAFTSTQLLPYQVGSDRPCDAPGVLCDFASLVDLKLLALDQILNRLEPAIPAAKLTLTTALLPTTTFEPIPFDGVEFDTDDMVNFSRSVFDILPQRTGVYFAVGYAEVTGGGGAGTPVSLGIGVTAYNIAVRSDVLRNPGVGTYYLRSYATFEWTGVDFSGAEVTTGVVMTVSPATTPFTISNATLAAYWVNDRVT